MALEVSELDVSYGAAKALHGVSLAVEPRTVVSVIGPNGAGKSTLLRGIMGLEPAGGDVSLDGASLRGRKTPARCRAGLSFVPDGPGIFSQMSVMEHIRVAAGRDWKRQWDVLRELFPLLDEKRDAHASDLSGGQKQTVSIARALASEPRYILLDEPSMGLSPVAIKGVISAVENLSTTGVGVLVVEQNASLALAVSDIVHVMVRGQIRRTATPAELEGTDTIEALYMGRVDAVGGERDGSDGRAPSGYSAHEPSQRRG